jgi:radical SAM protein with 4Fe4S-binding SPASM domain
VPVTQAFDFLIQWHLTERCNLRCKHCYQTSEKSAELSFQEISRIIVAADEMVRDWQAAYHLEFSPSFNITGGEPFLRSNFFKILEKMAETAFDLYILSNGTLITKEKARQVADLGVKGVQVSLEGPEGIHDTIRGTGSFSRAVAGIRTLLAAGVKVSINATLSQANAPYFMELVDLAVALGVPRLGFSRLVPAGQGLMMLDQMLSTEQVRQFYEEIFALAVDGLEITSGDPLASQMRSSLPAEDQGAIALGGCAAGVSGLTILADGTVTPCRRLPIPIGNVKRESLREIWATSPVLEALRDRTRYQGKCGACPRWAQCRGCRAIAHAYSQAQGRPELLAADPQCFIRDEAG